MEKNIGSYFDDANLLSRFSSLEDIVSICTLAAKFEIAGICAFPCDVADVEEVLDDMESDVKPISVISFPYGLDSIDTKLFAVEDAIENGAQEIDYVININALKEYAVDHLEEEALKLGTAPVPVKAIIEVSLLTLKELILVCKILNQTPVEFIKTCTGKVGSASKLSFEDKIRKVEIIKTYAPDKKVKFSGGVQTLEQATKLIDLGIDRIGSSSTFKIMRELYKEQL